MDASLVAKKMMPLWWCVWHSSVAVALKRDLMRTQCTRHELISYKGKITLSNFVVVVMSAK